MKYRFENIRIENNRIRISGFIAGERPDSDFSIAVTDSKNKDIPFELKRVRRDDVSLKYFRTMSEIDHGISLSFEYQPHKTYSLLVHMDYRITRIRINQISIAYHNGMQSLRNNRFLQSVKTRILTGRKSVNYQSWYEKHKPESEENA